jgi:hypothetical protein
MGNTDFKKALMKQFFKDGLAAENVRPSVEAALQEYFTDKGKRHTGSQFETFVRGSDPYQFTERDILAVSMLNVDIPARAALWILSPEGQSHTSELLKNVPVDVDIWHSEAANVFADDGNLDKLWKLLGRANWPTAASGGGLGGSTKRSKLIAAKRPRLVPVLDRVVIGELPKSENYWRAFQETLSDESIRESLAKATNYDFIPSEISLLRKIDIVIWMNNHKKYRKPKKKA